MKRLKTIIFGIIKLRMAIILVLALLMVISGYQTAKRLDIDNSLSIWFLEDDPSYKAYIDFQEVFGSDEIFIAMFPVKNAIGQQEKQTLMKLHHAVDSLSFVKTSFSLAKVKYPIYNNGTLVFSDMYNTQRSEKGQKTLLSKLPNVVSQLISKDYKHQFFYIQLNPTPDIEKDREIIAGQIRQTIERFYTTYYLTGPPVLNEAYSKGIYKESLMFGALTVLSITLMLLFLLPNKRYLLVALLCVAVPVSLLFGIITSLGYTLNMISMLIPTILMVYSVSDAVHIINIYHKEGLLNTSLKKIDVITLAVRKSITPCFYTTLTTVVGYFALYLSPLPAFKTMGVFTCVGLVLSFILVYVLTIIAFSFMSLDFKTRKPILSTGGLDLFLTWVNTATSRYRIGIISGFSLVLVWGLFSISRVKIDTDSLDLLAEGKAKEDLRTVEAQLHSSSRILLQISKISGSDILTKPSLEQLETFQKRLENNPMITAPVSVVDFKRFMAQRSPILFQPQISENEIKKTLASFENNDNGFFKLFSGDFKSVGITLSLRELKTSQLEQVLDAIKSDFEASFNTKAYKLKINGFAVVFAQLNNFILETQFKSFFAAFFVAFLCLWFFIRRIKTTLLVLIPNVLPLAVLAIAMSLLNIPLDVSTAMITPIMLGIAMDDTIHLVHKYRKSKRVQGTPSERMDRAMSYTGGALVSTTIALIAGFLIIASSATPSVSDFGILCAVTVAVALVTDIFYLPALLKQFDM